MLHAGVAFQSSGKFFFGRLCVLERTDAVKERLLKERTRLLYTVQRYFDTSATDGDLVDCISRLEAQLSRLTAYVGSVEPKQKHRILYRLSNGFHNRTRNGKHSRRKRARL